MIEYGFDENIDYQRVSQKCPTLGGVQEIVDYEIKLDMAKEITMIQRSAKGRQARKYFIEVEKMWNSPEMIMKRALEIANKKAEHLQLVTSKQKQLIGELKPKADYTDKILKNSGLVTITQKGRLFIYDLLKKNNVLPLIEK